MMIDILKIIANDIKEKSENYTEEDCDRVINDLEKEYDPSDESDNKRI